MDDVLIYSRILTGTEIQTINAGDALVDTNTAIAAQFTRRPLPGFIPRCVSATPSCNPPTR